MPQAVWVTTAVALSEPAVADDEVERDRLGSADERQVALDVHPVAAGLGLHAGRAEADVLAQEDLVVDGLVDVGHVVVAEGLHPAGALDHAKRRGVGGELHARVGRLLPDHELRLPGGHVDNEVVSGLRRRSPRSVRTDSVALSGPSRCLPAWIDTCRAYTATPE